MSPDEHDAVVGKTFREVGMLRREVAVADKVLADLSADLRSLAVYISEQIATTSSKSALPDLSTLHKYADFSRIVNLLRERKEKSEKLQSTKARLDEMDV